VPGIPYWKPLHPAVRCFCQLCGVELEAHEIAKERVLAMGDAAKQGDFYFGTKCCAGIAQQLATRIAEHRAIKAAELERDLDKELPELVADWTNELLGVRPASSQAVDRAAPAPARRRSRPGMIPDPQGNA
jgi:hypothetical protein